MVTGMVTAPLAVLVCGLPGAGKTTLAKQLASRPGHVLVTAYFTSFSPAEHKVRREERVRLALAAIAAGQVPVIDATAANRRQRLYWLNRIPKLKAVWVHTPVEVCIERRRARGRNWPSYIRQMAARAEIPTVDEGFVAVEVVTGDA